MEQIANPTFNDKIAETLAINGHPYIAFALVIMQVAIVVLIPLYSKWTTRKAEAIAKDKKRIVDLERAVTKKERDAENLELKNADKEIEHRLTARIEKLETSIYHRDEEIGTKLNTFEKMLDRMFSKMDKIEDTLKEQKKGG